MKMPEVDPDLANDPNYIACQRDIEDGKFVDLEPGQHVAYVGGKIFLTGGTDIEEFLAKINELNPDDNVYIHVANVPPRIVQLPDYIHLETWGGDPPEDNPSYN